MLLYKDGYNQNQIKTVLMWKTSRYCERITDTTQLRFHISSHVHDRCSKCIVLCKLNKYTIVFFITSGLMWDSVFDTVHNMLCNTVSVKNTISHQSRGEEKHYCVLFGLQVNIIQHTSNTYSGRGSIYENSTRWYLLSSRHTDLFYTSKLFLFGFIYNHPCKAAWDPTLC
jgi:hypothetical protein